MAHSQRGVGLGLREDLEGQLDQDTEGAQAADHQLRDVEAGSVLHHLAARAHDLARAIHVADTQDEVTHAAITVASRPAQPRGDRPAQRCARLDQRRVEREELPMLGQRRGDVFDGCAGQRGEGELARLVLDDAREARDVQRNGALRRRRERRLGAAAARQDARSRRRGAHSSLDLSDRGWAGQGGGHRPLLHIRCSLSRNHSRALQRVRAGELEAGRLTAGEHLAAIRDLRRINGPAHVAHRLHVVRAEHLRQVRRASPRRCRARR